MNASLRFLLMPVALLCVGCSRPIFQSTIDSAWNPPVLSKEGCSNIDGRYQDRNLLFRQFDFRLLSSNSTSIQGGYEVYQKIPFVPIKQPIKYVSGKATNETRIYEDESEFYKNAITSIKQQDQYIEATLIDEKGTKYRKSILVLDHPQVGCYNGALVIRRQYRTSGGEGNPGIITAGEHEFRKLDDGSLQVIKRTREWSRSLAEYPRKTETIQIFPPAP
jgi:hypothetical protein